MSYYGPPVTLLSSVHLSGLDLLLSDRKIHTLPSPSKTSMGSNVQILECSFLCLNDKGYFYMLGRWGLWGDLHLFSTLKYYEDAELKG